MQINIVLVNPLYQGNIGSVARVMKNFGFDKLILINPCSLGDYARAMASHAVDVLDSARFQSLEQILQTSTIVIGATGIVGARSYLRSPYPLAKLNEKLSNKNGVASILLGSEDQGLSNSVLDKCDLIVNIKTSPVYPIMNISHAAAVILYHLSNFTPRTSAETINLASHKDLERLLNHTNDVLDDIQFPQHKRTRVLSALKRIYGKSELTSKEVRMLRGILSRIQFRVK